MPPPPPNPGTQESAVLHHAETLASFFPTVSAVGIITASSAVTSQAVTQLK
jgi:hypothetical protein